MLGFDGGQVPQQTRGWPVIWHGVEYGPALVVLDLPAGPRWTDLPEAWHAFAETHQIAWCRVEEGTVAPHRVEDVLETLADRNVHTHLVAAGPLADVAAHLADEFERVVRTVVTVDEPLDSVEAAAEVETAVAAGVLRAS